MLSSCQCLARNSALDMSPMFVRRTPGDHNSIMTSTTLPSVSDFCTLFSTNLKKLQTKIELLAMSLNKGIPNTLREGIWHGDKVEPLSVCNIVTNIIFWAANKSLQLLQHLPSQLLVLFSVPSVRKLHFIYFTLLWPLVVPITPAQ